METYSLPSVGMLEQDRKFSLMTRTESELGIVPKHWNTGWIHSKSELRLLGILRKVLMTWYRSIIIKDHETPGVNMQAHEKMVISS